MSLFPTGMNLLQRQFLIGKAFPTLQSFTVQVREAHARRLAVARTREKKLNLIKRLPHLTTSRNVEKEDAASEEQVVLSKDGRVIACWHPEVPFPYEMTRPIPVDVTPTDSNLKLQALLPVRSSSVLSCYELCQIE